MDKSELEARQKFQEQQRIAREMFAYDRQLQRQKFQEKRELAKMQTQADIAELSNAAALERLIQQAQIDSDILHQEFLYGEWARHTEHQRALELAMVEFNRMEHATNQEIRLENNRHANAKDYKTHETDEFIRLKKAFGELSAEDQAKFFAQFSAQETADKGGGSD